MSAERDRRAAEEYSELIWTKLGGAAHEIQRIESAYLNGLRAERARWAGVEAERDENARDVMRLQGELAEARGALELIAAPKRPDGTYNRDREACEELARAALRKRGE